MNDSSSYHKMTVSPQQASEWLGHNTHNRTIRKSWVKELTRRITNGLWRTTHQGIAFDCNGVIIDGQHRLLAIVAAAQSVVMWVFFEGQMEDQLVVDDHGKRSPFDALSLSDMSVSGELTRSHVSAARSMVTASTQSYRWSNQELRDFVESHYSAIDFSYVHLLSRSSKAHITTATLAAVISRAYYHESHDRLVEFCEMIYTGKVTDDQDTAALRLRDWLLGQQGRASGTGGSMRVAIYRRAQRAVAAFCKRKPLAKLYAANEELYPIPHNGHV